MEGFREFLNNQTSIYRQFDVKMEEAQQAGLMPDPILTEEKGGYMIALPPPRSLTAFLTSFLPTVQECIPDAVVYPLQDLHITVSDYKVVAKFNPDADQKHASDQNKLAEVCRIAFLGNHTVEWRAEGLAFNQTTLVLKGTPDLEFFKIARDIVDAAQAQGLQLRMPWGAHITLARFSQRASAQVAQKLADLCAEVQLVPEWRELQHEYFLGCFKAHPDAFKLYKVRKAY